MKKNIPYSWAPACRLFQFGLLLTPIAAIAQTMPASEERTLSEVSKW
jgi:hypothetical protein